MRLLSARGCLSLLGMFVALLLIAYLLRAPILRAAAYALVEDDGARKCDVILVLGGDGHGTRILKAAELAKEGYAPRVLVSSPAVFTVHEADLTIPYIARRGFQASLFEAVPHDCTSTRCEAELFRQYFRAHAVRNVMLVTSNFHTRRAARLMRSVNPGVSFDVVAAPDPEFNPNNWWKQREYGKTFVLEWSKTIASWLGE
jgi:uncharacterized SAM-binding protein YcdF (DUF218 family)